MKRISKIFLTGIVTVLPIIATTYFLVWLASSADALIGRIIRFVLPDQLYIPGMGLILGILIVFVTGLLMHAWFVQKLFSLWEQLLFRLPLIKSVYGAFRDFLNFFSGTKDKEFQQVVAIDLGDTGLRVMGFVTREDASSLPDGLKKQNAITVYIPLSYQIGGLTAVVPKSAVSPVTMPMEDAMRFILTAGITSQRSLKSD
jgi:uncharacterized membrane protein